jgi:peptidoglycan/xylan/chitin deacetylase (PgdA/CDA1 family)
MPGISISKFSIPFSGGGGTDWDAYWASLISATVENAAPTDVVLTFPAPAAVGAADFTVTVNAVNRVVSFASWMGAVLTLVLASDVYFEDIVVATFVKSSGTANVTNNITHPLALDDGNTDGWYEHDLASSFTFRTTTGIDYSAQWRSLIGAAHLVQATEASQPFVDASGVSNLSTRFMTRAGFNLPATVYVVAQATAYVNVGTLLGDAGSKLSIIQTADDPAYALGWWIGSKVGANTDSVKNTEELITIIANGASSSIQIDDHAPVGANIGAAASVADLYLMSLTNTGAFQGRFKVKYLIIRDGVEGATDKAAIQDYLNKKRVKTWTEAMKFKITVDTSKAGSGAATFVLPLPSAGFYDYYVDWGEGGADEHFIVNTSQTHVYAAGGTYQIAIWGYFPRIYFNNAGDKLKLMTIDQWGDIVWESMGNAFQGCANVMANYTDRPNTSWVKNMGAMFSGCTLFNGSLTGIDISLVTTMEDIYRYAYALSLLNYEAMLIDFASQTVKDSVLFHAGDCTYTEGGAAEAARTHLTATHSWTITDNGPSFDNGKMVIAFDDGGVSQYNAAYPELLSRGIGATFYVISDEIGVGSCMTWANLQTMDAAGMDIQCHTKDHTALTLLDQAGVLAEYQGVNDAFATNSLPAPRHTAYPGGANNANVQTWTATMRDTARGIVNGNVFKSSNKMHLGVYGMDININTLKSLMDAALVNKEAMMFLSHGIGGAQTPLATFTEIIDYGISIGLDIITTDELYALM